MSYPMFPEDEVIAVDENVFIHKPKWEGSEYKVWLVVGVQYFEVGMPHQDLESAQWHAKMLVKAISKLKGD